jgi:hypothetical protein
MGLTRKHLLRRAETKENEGWMAGLTGERWAGHNQTFSYEWGKAVSAALRMRRESCESKCEYQFGASEFNRLIETAVKKNLLEHE